MYKEIKDCTECTKKAKANLRKLIKLLREGYFFDDAVDQTTILNYSVAFNLFLGQASDKNRAELLPLIEWRP